MMAFEKISALAEEGLGMSEKELWPREVGESSLLGKNCEILEDGSTGSLSHQATDRKDV